MVRYSSTRTKTRKTYSTSSSSPPTQKKTRRNVRHSSGNKICTSTMTFQDCELAILRHAVDTNEKQKGERIAQSPEMKEMFRIVEDFIRKHKLVCYGGTAI